MNVIAALLLLVVFVIALIAMERPLISMGKKARNFGARVTGPLFSIGASGTVGKALTFGSWKGIQWVREWFKPSNPQSVKQVIVRHAFDLTVIEWATDIVTTPQKDAYDVGAEGEQFSGFNLWQKRSMDAFIDQFDTSTPMLSVSVSGNYPSDVITWVEVT